MTPRPLPHITDTPKAAFRNGWWSGIAVGTCIGLGAAVVLLELLK